MIALVRYFGLVDYQHSFTAMRDFSLSRQPDTQDEIWCLQHEPVYTLGLNGNREHLLRPTDIPVIDTDRGGQVTYHGPGQLVVYPLLDMRRKNFGVKTLVNRLEQSVIDLLTGYAIEAERKAGAPGVYVQGEKISAIGIRLKRGCTWHGLSLNVNMDLEPFNTINPCGYVDLPVTQVSHYVTDKTIAEVAADLMPILINHLELPAAKTLPMCEWTRHESARAV